MVSHLVFRVLRLFSRDFFFDFLTRAVRWSFCHRWQKRFVFLLKNKFTYFFRSVDRPMLLQTDWENNDMIQNHLKINKKI